MKSMWEQVDPYTFRMQVPGGWVIKCLENIHHFYPETGREDDVSEYDFRIAVCFVPDPNHEWRL